MAFGTEATVTSLFPIDPSVVAVLFAPNVTGSDLSEVEQRTMTLLAQRLMNGQLGYELELSELYYEGRNIVPSLGISVPPELEPLRAVLGWCAAGVDARSERLTVQGFRMPGQTTIDAGLHEIWQHNNMDSESVIMHDAALIYSRSYAIVGPSDDGSGIPLITTESPRNMIASWDVRRREISAAYQTYLDIDPASETYLKQLATLYTRDAIIQMVNSSDGWVVQDRNDHQQGFAPVVQFTNRPKVHNRLGCSEMSNAWRNTQDRACRSLQSMEVAREFFAATKIFILGATEESFLKSDGTKASAWETYIGRISGLEADQHGNLPQIVSVPGSQPDGFIRSLDHERQIMAGHTGLPPQYLGIYSDGNPASADAIRMSDFRLKMTADRLATQFGEAWEQLMRMALKIAGEYSDTAEQMETDWNYTGIPTPSADTVNVTTQVAAEMVPPTSDDALAAVGWSPVQRQRIAAERKKQQGLAVIDQAVAGLKPPAQATDGEQPQALANLNAKRSNDGATAG